MYLLMEYPKDQMFQYPLVAKHFQQIRLGNKLTSKYAQNHATKNITSEAMNIESFHNDDEFEQLVCDVLDVQLQSQHL